MPSTSRSSSFIKTFQWPRTPLRFSDILILQGIKKSRNDAQPFFLQSGYETFFDFQIAGCPVGTGIENTDISGGPEGNSFFILFDVILC